MADDSPPSYEDVISSNSRLNDNSNPFASSTQGYTPPLPLLPNRTHSETRTNTNPNAIYNEPPISNFTSDPPPTYASLHSPTNSTDSSDEQSSRQRHFHSRSWNSHRSANRSSNRSNQTAHWRRCFAVLAVSCILPLAVLIAGLVEQDCHFEKRISPYMISSGITTITCFGCLALGLYIKAETERNTLGNVLLVIGIILWVCLFGLQIWGSIIIFPHLDKWHSKLDPFPCNQHIFNFGFSMITLFWILTGLSINFCLKGILDKS